MYFFTSSYIDYFLFLYIHEPAFYIQSFERCIRHLKHHKTFNVHTRRTWAVRVLFQRTIARRPAKCFYLTQIIIKMNVHANMYARIFALYSETEYVQRLIIKFSLCFVMQVLLSDWDMNSSKTKILYKTHWCRTLLPDALTLLILSTSLSFVTLKLTKEI